MNNREFVLWLWGFLEICYPQPITRKMLFIIRNHLNLVKAVDGKLGEFNQNIYDQISKALEATTPPQNEALFISLKESVGTRLQELSQEEA